MSSRVLIIVGMHRSGTSLITQWLHRCGLSIGEELYPADMANKEGYFEDTDFLKAHQQLLKKRSHPSTGFIDQPVGRLQQAEVKTIQDIIDRKSKKMEWGWKEPRTCLFLDVYNKLIPSAYYLVVVRDYASTVSSLLTREYKMRMKKFRSKKGLSRLKWILLKRKTPEKVFEMYAERFLKVWIHYYERIFNHVSSLPGKRYMFVHYGCLVKNDKDAFDRLKDDWNFSLQYIPFANIYKTELLSRVYNVDKFIKNKELIAKAKKIERNISDFFLASQ